MSLKRALMQQIVLKIYTVLEHNATLECINKHWLEHFHLENFNLQDKSRSSRYSDFDNDALKHY